MTLTDNVISAHYAEITAASAVSPDVAEARGYRTLHGTQLDREELAEMGFRRYVWDVEETYPALLIPMHGADGTVRGHQLKPAVPRVRTRADGQGGTKQTAIKYESPAGAPLMLDIPEFTRTRLPDTGVALWLTEGMKKVDSLVSRDIAAIGLTGVFNWRNKMGTLGDWEDVPVKGRLVVVCFDADARENRNVQLAMTRLGAWLKTKGAREVRYIVVPADVNGTAVKGVDDYFAAGGTEAGLAEASTLVPPGGGPANAAFTDAFLVDDACQEALEGQFCWAAGLGWLKWDGRVWVEVSDVEPLEAVRQWALSKFEAAASEQGKDPSRDLGSQVQGWRAILGGARLRTLVSLARGIVQRAAEEFDSDPDLITAQNGTVHLPTGKLLPFDPAHSITRMAGAEYRPGYRHAVWDKALSAVPEELHPWYRDRLGQALTGYKTPDHMLVLSQGSGSNGKSTITSVVRRTLGAYGVVISDRVLMASPDAHPTELMDFRGARYAVLEETPEARHLNVQRLKTTLGTETIKARRIRQDPVEFLATHSLFINSNYRPVVNETDHGTWRRLSLLTFPYTFRKRERDMTGPWDRLGDPSLEYAHDSADVRAAALAWMTGGAQAWYDRGRMMLEIPELVEQDTREWRAETDLVMGFTDECLTFDRESVVQVQEMLSAFNDWAGERGHRPWNDKTFATRFGSHDVIRGQKVAQGRTYLDGRRVRVWTGVRTGQDGGDPFDGGQMPAQPAPEEPDGRSRNGNGTGGTADPINHQVSKLTRGNVELPVPPVPLPVTPAQTWGNEAPELDPGNPDTPERVGDQGPVTLGFDIETASADELFRGRHEGPFVRLVGGEGGAGPVTCTDPSALVEDLERAEVIYGHNILGFDLVALAHHHGADYDALAAKAIDTFTLSQLAWPSGAKGDREDYSLDAVAKRLGHTGKSDDLKALAKEFGGYDKIPVNDARYVDYLRGDLAATQHVFNSFGDDYTETFRSDYVRRELKVAAIQNRMTLNGWRVDTELLAQRVAHEDEQRTGAAQQLAERFGMPLAPPDKIKLRLKADWPEDYRNELSVAAAREGLAEDPDRTVEAGLADRVPQPPYAAPWATDAGRAALIEAFRAAGAEHYPRTATGQLALSSDALGEGTWYDKKAGKARPAMLKVYGHLPGVRELCRLITQATGATAKYAEIQEWTTPAGRVHAVVSDVQASGRWATKHPASANLDRPPRQVFLPEPGHVLLTCDMSQVDVRAMAGHSQDPELIAALQPGKDYHSEMAEVFFGDRSRRSDGKPISHGLNYNQGARAIAESKGLDLRLVEQAKSKHRERFHVLADWTAELIAHAETGVLLDNGFGRLMKCDPERAYTQAPALMGQGAARDLMCEGLLRLVEARPGVTPYLRGVVHDEVILSVPEDEVNGWAGSLVSAFTFEWKGVPILCSVSNPGRNWLECEH